MAVGNPRNSVAVLDRVSRNRLEPVTRCIVGSRSQAVALDKVARPLGYQRRREMD